MDEASCPKKHKAVDIVGALRAGMDKLVAATQSTLQGIGSSEVVQRFWVCLQARLVRAPLLSFRCRRILLIFCDCWVIIVGYIDAVIREVSLGEKFWKAWQDRNVDLLRLVAGVGVRADGMHAGGRARPGSSADRACEAACSLQEDCLVPGCMGCKLGHHGTAVTQPTGLCFMACS